MVPTSEEYQHVQKQQDQRGIQDLPSCNLEKQIHHLLSRMYPLRNPICRQERVADEY